MRYYEASFPVTWGDLNGRATVRVTLKQWAPTLLPGWSFCLAGPFAIGFDLHSLPLAGADLGPPRRLVRTRNGAN